MKSSERQAPGGVKVYYGKQLYGILVAYIPLSILFLLIHLLGTIYWLLGSALPGFNSFDEKIWGIAGFLSAAAAACYAGIMKKSAMSHGAADIRGGITAGMAAYLFVSLIRINTPFAEKFIPSIDSITSVFAAVFMWFAPIKLRNIFSVFEHLESLSHEYQGDDLRSIIREFSSEMGEADVSLRQLMANYGTMLILSCLMLTGTGFPNTSFFYFVFVLFIFCTGFIVLCFLRLLRRELVCASGGFSVTLKDRAVLFPVAGLGIAAALFLALLASSNTSIIPPEVIPMFFLWLLKLISSLFRPREPGEIQLPEPEPMPPLDGSLGDALSAGEYSGPWAGWRYIKYGLIALAIFLFALFMVYPLLKRSRSSVNAGMIRDAIVNWFSGLKKGIIAFFGALRGWSAFGIWGKGKGKKKPDREKLRSIVSQLLGGTQKKELAKSVGLFARLILWGNETLKVSWRPSLPPGEFCGLLVSKIDNAEDEAKIYDRKKMTEAITVCGKLFEKALYSPWQLSREEERAFRDAVNSVCA